MLDLCRVRIQESPGNSFASCRGEVINGGFGLVLDGTQEAEQKAKMMLSWDVSNGVSHPMPPLKVATFPLHWWLCPS